MTLKTYKNFLLIYFLLGLSPCYTIFSSESSSRFVKVYRRIPSCISLAISLAFFIHFCIMNRTIFLLYGKINNFISYCYLLTLLLTNVSGTYQCLRYQSEYSDLMRRNFGNGKLPHLGPYQACRTRRKFMVTGLIIFATYSLAVLVLILNETTMDSIFFKIEIAVLHFVSSLSVLHKIMYIEMLRSYMEASGSFILNESLYHKGIRLEEIYWNLKRLKKVYFDWWNIVQKISAYFGWSMLALIVKCFVEISYTFYYYFVMLQSDTDGYTILRNYLNGV